uniref:Alpha carbonic anhydrase 7-like n=1 Tax=Elaeis guineensis var. tenera TaxID=51953 RepID=A0A6I9QNB4_ELAGV
DEKYFNYDENSEFGPEHWGELDPDWAACKDGKKQSPIDINHKNIKENSSIGSLMTFYNSTYAIMQNRGYEIRINWTEGTRLGAGFLLIDGKAYVLQQCHWHSPAEHKFLGR